MGGWSSTNETRELLSAPGDVFLSPKLREIGRPGTDIILGSALPSSALDRGEKTLTERHESLASDAVSISLSFTASDRSDKGSTGAKTVRGIIKAC